jgi:nucleotide-binding universal stress UspA family protein
MAAPEGDVTLLHVINQEFIDDAVAASLGTSEEIRNRLKEQAEASFSSMLEGIDAGHVNIDLPMIIMGVRGRSTPPEELLFGSTAEKVLRGSRVPVLCVPF